MSLYTTLQLVSVLILDPPKDAGYGRYPVLGQMLDDIGLSKSTCESPKRLEDFFYNVLCSVEDRFAYYGRSELKVNSLVDDYLKVVLKDLWDGKFERSTTLAMAICGSGNKGLEMNATQAVNEIVDDALGMIKRMEDLLEDHEDRPLPEAVLLICRRLEYLDHLLEMVDVFVTTRVGSMLGAPEYPPVPDTIMDEIPEPDFEITGTECLKDDSCGCGCRFDHPLMVIEGMEHFFAGVQSKERAYFEGVVSANGIRLALYTGNEGATFDAIKELGRKAWEQLVESLKAIKTLFTDNTDEEKVKTAETAGENNKKAFQAMKDIPSKINDQARASIIALSENIDISGKVKAIVAKLNTPSDGPRIIDALMGLMSKEVGTSGEINKAFEEATAAVNELKTAADGAGTGDENNKDVVKANKSKVQTKTKAAKETLKKVKFQLGAHNKLVDGIKKAITGISPKIFIVDADKSKDKDKE